MPVKNAGLFLEECLSSILSQTETDWELIAVNDHSTDNTLQLLQRFAKQETRISVLENSGSGIIDALRTAYSAANGNLITRMDADDRMAPQKLEILKENLLREKKGNVATGLVNYFSDAALGDGYRYYEKWLNGLTKQGNNYQDIYRECVIPSPCWMVFRADLDACKAFEPDVYPEDYDLCFRFYQHKLKPIPCSDLLHFWRDHAARTSRNDPHYADNRFLQLKLHWFLKIDHNPEKTLVLWGAAKKGKELAKGLLAAKIPFTWVCNNPNKINKHVYGQKMLNANVVSEMKNTQFIIAVANKDEQEKIELQMKNNAAFFFC
ncbi:MAG: glycosyltransferase family 2 protein [Flavobacteriales bacterium]|nr:glycosyltransferase family 2 protein [Flavobacteriales bacterium]